MTEAEALENPSNYITSILEEANSDINFSQYDNDYGVAGQLFVTNDGLLNITYETGSTVAVPPVWTEGPDTVSTRKDHASVFGTQNATLISGGRNPSADTSFTED